MSGAVRRVVVIGAGGHARVCIDQLLDDPTLELIGCLGEAATSSVDGVPVLGDDGMLPPLRRDGVTHAFVAIGDNRRRLDVMRRCRAEGFALVNAISRAAVISRSCTIGAGVALMPGSIVNAGSVLHDGVIVNTNASIDHDCILEAGAHVAPGCALSGNVRVGEGAFLGAGCVVIPGRTVGAWSTVGAGACVVWDVADGAVVVGVPARGRG